MKPMSEYTAETPRSRSRGFMNAVRMTSSRMARRVSAEQSVCSSSGTARST
jgi:hypothetical protein